MAQGWKEARPHKFDNIAWWIIGAIAIIVQVRLLKIFTGLFSCPLLVDKILATFLVSNKLLVSNSVSILLNQVTDSLSN